MKDWFKKTFTKENLKKFYFSFIWLAVIAFVLDIVSKWIVIKTFGPEAIANADKLVAVIPQFLYIAPAANSGAAWSMGANMRWFWICVSLIMSAGLITYYVKKFKTLSTWVRVALSLMIAGAVGNLIDRAFYWPSTVGFSGVVDFIAVWLGDTLRWFPTFNIADSALVIGVIILLIVIVVELIKEVHEKDKRGEYDLKPLELEKKQKEEAAAKAAAEASKSNEENKD